MREGKKADRRRGVVRRNVEHDPAITLGTGVIAARGIGPGVSVAMSSSGLPASSTRTKAFVGKYASSPPAAAFWMEPQRDPD